MKRGPTAKTIHRIKTIWKGSCGHDGAWWLGSQRGFLAHRWTQMNGDDLDRDDAKQRERDRLWKQFRKMEAEIDQIEIDTLAWNEMHPESWLNPDVSLERARLEERRKSMPK